MSNPGTSHVPHIDLAAIVRDGVDASRSQRVLEQIGSACRETGFMTVTGHCVPQPVIEQALAAAHEFFGLSPEAKLRVAARPWGERSPNVYRGYFPSHANGKEGLDIGDPSLDASMTELLARPYYELNRFPAELGPAWRGALARYFDELFNLGQTLMRAMVACLGGDPRLVGSAFARPGSLSTLRLNGYPRRAAPVEISEEDGAALACETHVDSGLLTILYQDPEAGLQVRDRDRRWQDVAFCPDGFVVNTGLAFQRISNGAVAATRHRVLQPVRERISIPFFLEPTHEFRIAPASLGFAPDAESDAPEAVTYEAFLRVELAKFAEYDRSR